VIRNGLTDPDSDVDRHQNVISWSLGHTPALHKISSKSVVNFFDNPLNADFGLQTPGSGRWSGSSPKLNSLVHIPRNFVKIRSQVFQLSNGQTDRQTDRSENITSFGGGNNAKGTSLTGITAESVWFSSTPSAFPNSGDTLLYSEYSGYKLQHNIKQPVNSY